MTTFGRAELGIAGTVKRMVDLTWGHCGVLLPGLQLVKLCIAMIDTGKAFCVANKQFMNGIRDLAQYSSNDAVVEVSIIKLSYNDQCNMLLNNYIYVPY